MPCIYNILNNFHKKALTIKPSKLSGCLGPLFCKELTGQGEKGQDTFLSTGRARPEC